MACIQRPYPSNIDTYILLIHLDVGRHGGPPLGSRRLSLTRLSAHDGHQAHAKAAETVALRGSNIGRAGCTHTHQSAYTSIHRQSLTHRPRCVSRRPHDRPSRVCESAWCRSTAAPLKVSPTPYKHPNERQSITRTPSQARQWRMHFDNEISIPFIITSETEAEREQKREKKQTGSSQANKKLDE